MVICEQIRKVKNGYIVVVRDPYGDSISGEAVCKTFEEVVELLRCAANEDEMSKRIQQAGMRGLVSDGAPVAGEDKA